MTDKKKFTASFSTGKDCTLAIYKAIKAGYEPAGLITTRNTDGKIAWFHQLPGTCWTGFLIVSVSLYFSCSPAAKIMKRTFRRDC
ncbi:MAG: hypothetical protein ACLVI4_02965 [Anaerovoracaceae bacterium]